MRKPLQVKILEWWFGILAGIASLLPLLLVCVVCVELWCGRLSLAMLPGAVGLGCGSLFFWGLFLAVRRGQWASAEFPYLSLVLFFPLLELLYPPVRSHEDAGSVVRLFVALVLTAVPLVLFHLRVSQLWFKVRRGNRRAGFVSGCLVSLIIVLFSAVVFMSASCSRTGKGQQKGSSKFKVQGSKFEVQSSRFKVERNANACERRR